MTPLFRSEELVVWREADGYLVEVAGIATFRVAPDGTALRLVDRSADASDELVAIARDHYVAPRTHQLRGWPTLHGSAVGRGGRAVAFLGLSGSGKSTLAAHLAEAGALLADDAVLLRPLANGFEVEPTATKVRLREASAERLGVADREGAPWTRFVRQFPAAKPAPLVRVYLLEEAPEVSVAPVAARDALLGLTRFVHRLDPVDPGLLTRELELLERLSRDPGVRRLAFPTRFDVLDEVADVVDRDLATLASGGP